MTTNVLDFSGQKLTCDSRWSLILGQYLVFVDDTGFDKIADRIGATMVMAGDAQLIDEWKEWFFRGDEEEELPQTFKQLADGSISGVCMAIVEKPTFTVLLTAGRHDPFEELAAFCGSGATPAMVCYASNRCAVQCVHSAMLKDPQTGGDVKFVEIATMGNNLSVPRVGYKEAEDALIERGSIMDLKTGNIFPIGPVDRDFLKARLKAGDVSLTAPTGQITRGWTSEEKDAAREAMRRIRARERSSSND